MADPFVAEIRIFGFNYAPTGWAHCDGQLLPISQNTALFSLLGTMYGGDGKSTFALPDLQGTAPLAWGQGPGLSDYAQGEVGGSEFVTLIQTEMPVHTHQMRADTLDPADVNIPSPTSSYAQSTGGTLYQDNPADPVAFLDPLATQIAGASFPHNNLMPYLTFNFCIALQGVFPPRG
jgi:microcystin-dependent protein